MSFQTEFEFTLPMATSTPTAMFTKRIDASGYGNGRIRAAARHAVRSNQAYLVITLLSRVVTRLGNLESITPQVIENLFAADLAYLQALYRTINEEGRTTIQVTCPDCGAQFAIDLADLGVAGYPSNACVRR
ncbi:MAG: hypothetical protein R2873_10135 [Caldilineaceae bacterium]